MYADVLGLQPLQSSWVREFKHSERTLQDLYSTPLRRSEFDRYGIWAQFDLFAGGYLSSPSYGQGYAIQTLLLLDNHANGWKGALTAYQRDVSACAGI